MTAPTGWNLVAAYCAVEDDYEAAANLLADLKCSKRQQDALLPVIAWAVAHQRRSEIRVVERVARNAMRSRVADGGGTGTSHDARLLRKQIAVSTFSLGDGSARVSWGDATVEQHEQRITMLEKNIGGLRVTIDMHRDAIRQILEAGVSCLNEIPEHDTVLGGV